MAWKFLDTSKPANKRFREESMQAINAWWAHFQNKRKNIEAFLEGRAHWNIEDFMADSLQAIDENLMWEFGNEAEGKFNLVITPETERHLRPMVDTIIQTAPKISNWAFYAYRQPHGYEATVELVKDQSRLDITNLSFNAEYDDEHLIDLAFKYKGDASEEALADAVFTSCEYLLGEEILDRWIGDMTFAKEGGAEFKPISELPNTVLKLIEEMKASMHDQPIHKLRDKLEIVGFSLDAEEMDDNDSSERFDMTMAKTRVPQVWQAAHSGSPFDSCRFSKHGERFAYLKLEGEYDEKKIEAVEEAINKALASAGAGCTTGSAVGKNHGYVDLCFADPDKAVNVMKEACKSAGCPSQTWLQFFDADWAGEWIAIGSGVATPPGMVEIK